MGQAARRQRVCSERISFIDALRWLASAHDDEFLPALVVNPHRPSRDAPRGCSENKSDNHVEGSSIERYS